MGQGRSGSKTRAQHYGHRAASFCFTGGRQTGKSFLARKLEAMLVAEGRHAYLLDAENLRRGLDADLSESDAAHADEMVGDTARWRGCWWTPDSSSSSDDNPFASPIHHVTQSIRTLVHPTPVIAVHMSKTSEEEPPANTDVVFSGPIDLRCRHRSHPRGTETPRRPGSGDWRKAGFPIFNLRLHRSLTRHIAVENL